MVAEVGSWSDAVRGGLPKPTDDSLTGFLQASSARSKMGLAHAEEVGASPRRMDWSSAKWGL